jgi:hypothetical protein
MVPKGDGHAAEQLEALTIEIGRKEAETDATYFDGLLAPAFVMRRANKERALIDREAFLDALRQAEKKPRDTRVTSISLLGSERAIVTCVVTMDRRDYDNLGVLVRNNNPAAGRPWLLVAWINEPVVP